jgi:phosphoglucosamine mutase
VVEHGYDIGIAHDGDADRCLAVDASGAVVDGDQIMAILALAMRDRGDLSQDTVVATVMSNLGFLQAMGRNGINVVQTAVGDRYVLEEMRAKGYNLGGEQSGHVIMSDFASTGDGTLTALQLLARMSQTGQSLSQLAGVMTKLPQVLINVKGVNKSGISGSEALAAAVSRAEAYLGETGRVLLRSSGTEPVIRVMVEAPTDSIARGVAEDLAGVVSRELRLG